MSQIHQPRMSLLLRSNWRSFKALEHLPKIAVVICAALAGLVAAKKRIATQFRARNQVEKTINVALALCSGVAISNHDWYRDVDVQRSDAILPLCQSTRLFLR